MKNISSINIKSMFLPPHTGVLVSRSVVAIENLVLITDFRILIGC